jgi:diadenosine tetraphosphatase ApaH/serine/threonine PP2A family protein phosphatase
MFMEVFDSLPISAVVAKKYLAMHGGISPEMETID